MKIMKKNKDQQAKSPVQPTSLYFPYCCPQNCIEGPAQSSTNKKANKFLKLTLLKQKSQSHIYLTTDPKDKTPHNEVINHEVQQFQSDKSDFLSIIRKFNPNPQNQKDEPTHGKTLQSSKQISSSLRSGQNNLSSLLQNLSNDVFSEMFVSSTIKGKIMLSGSLGSISEVKSDMEISCPTESLVYGLHFTEDN